MILPLYEIIRCEVTGKDVLFAQKLCVLVHLNAIGRIAASLNIRKEGFVFLKATVKRLNPCRLQYAVPAILDTVIYSVTKPANDRLI